MSIIDIDRHIVTDMAAILKDMEKADAVVHENFIRTSEFTAQLIECHRMKNCDQIEKLFKSRQKHIDKAYRATIAQSKHMSELKALLMHIVNQIHVVDTGKGKEHKQ